jgi:pantoate--beta-alanine ligase
MEVVHSPDELRARTTAQRAANRRIAFVPTMGYLHAGHVSLLDEGRRRGDVLVLSIFVNPTQFGPTEDLARYPRDLDGDLAKARTAGCDLVFVPEAAAMYPPGHQTFVEVTEMSKGLCGDRRPTHFRGVTTVVLKLFHLVQPHVALFGEKDYQQLQVIRRMVRDLQLDIEVAGLPIVREPDGLAMSSRNAYLSAADRRLALALSRALAAAERAVSDGERDAHAVKLRAHAVLAPAEEEGLRLDYVELRDAETLAAVDGPLARPVVLALAAFAGTTRLIDNRVLRP